VSNENVELARRVLEAREREGLEALFALYDPEIVWDQHAGPFELVGVYHGHDGVREFWRQWLESFATHHAHPETFIEAGDKVVVGMRIVGRGKTSGIEVEMPRWTVMTIRNALVTRIEVFERKAEALEAAGLQE
jgi:ketosteroid isomerase-like protein